MNNDCRIRYPACSWFEVGINKKNKRASIVHVHFAVLAEVSSLGAGSELGIPTSQVFLLQVRVFQQEVK